MGAIYLMAFASYYLQFPGLYGQNGLEPTQNSLFPTNQEAPQGRDFGRDFAAWFQKPCLALFSPSIYLDVDTVMEGTALLGMGLSALAMVGCHSALVFAALFLLYLSLYTAGGTFMGFQWDIFLLETGVLTTLYAPLWLDSSAPCPGPKLLLRWLAFKFMLSSGVVKLTAMDSTWQNLTAMEYHFATTCLATSQAWLLHNLPPWALRLSTAVMFVTEIPAAFLLLAPWRMARRASAFLQVRCTLLPEETSPRRAAVWSGLGETGRRKPAGGSTTRVNAGGRGTRGGEAGDGTPPFDTLVVLVSYQALRERT
jgi:hypothetical protein